MKWIINISECDTCRGTNQEKTIYPRELPDQWLYVRMPQRGILHEGDFCSIDCAVKKVTEWKGE